MGSKKFTLIELHLDGDAQFGPRTLDEALSMFSGATDDQTETETEWETDDDGAAADDSSGKPIGAIVGLVALVALAVAVKKFRGGDEEDDDLEGFEEFDERDEPDVIVD